MPDFDDNDDFDDEPEQPPARQRREPTPAEIRIWRNNSRKWEEAESRLTTLERENLLLRTPGLSNLTDRQMKALFATHDGELTPDSLRETAQDLGFVAPPEPDVPEAEAAAHQRTINASAGSDPHQADPLASVLAAETQEEFWERARAAGLAE